MTNLDVLRDCAKNGVVTHCGTFHADDVMTGALLVASGVCTSNSIQRVQSIPEGFQGLAFDVGRGAFDHHQPDAEVRSNGTKFAALGLIWDFAGRDILKTSFNCDDESAEIAFVDFDAFIQSMDLTDNFGPDKYPNTLSYLISALSSNDCSDQSYHDAVWMFVKPMIAMITRVAQNAKSKILAKKLGQKEIVIIDNGNYIPAICFKGTKAKFIVQKSNREGLWNLNAVNPYSIVLEKEQMRNCNFVHTAKFLATFNSLEDASKAAFDNVAAMNK